MMTMMAIMLKSLREERQQTYSIFLPIHPETRSGSVCADEEGLCRDLYTVTFDDEDGQGMDSCPLRGAT